MKHKNAILVVTFLFVADRRYLSSVNSHRNTGDFTFYFVKGLIVVANSTDASGRGQLPNRMLMLLIDSRGPLLIRWGRGYSVVTIQLLNSQVDCYLFSLWLPWWLLPTSFPPTPSLLQQKKKRDKRLIYCSLIAFVDLKRFVQQVLEMSSAEHWASRGTWNTQASEASCIAPKLPPVYKLSSVFHQYALADNSALTGVGDGCRLDGS